MHVTALVHPRQPGYLLDSSARGVTASVRPLNDSVDCRSSLQKLLTVWDFIIDETLSAWCSNMQDLQTSVRLNTLLSECLHHHLILTWNGEGIFCVCVRVHAIVSSTLFLAKLTPHYSSRIVSAQPLTPGFAFGPLHTPQGSLSSHTQAAEVISCPAENFFRADKLNLCVHVHKCKKAVCCLYSL